MNPEQIKVAAFNNDQFEFEKDDKGRFIKDKFGNYTYTDLENDSTYSKSEGEILRNYQTSLEENLDGHVFTLTFLLYNHSFCNVLIIVVRLRLFSLYKLGKSQEDSCWCWRVCIVYDHRLLYFC